MFTVTNGGEDNITHPRSALLSILYYYIVVYLNGCLRVSSFSWRSLSNISLVHVLSNSRAFALFLCACVVHLWLLLAAWNPPQFLYEFCWGLYGLELLRASISLLTRSEPQLSWQYKSKSRKLSQCVSKEASMCGIAKYKDSGKVCKINLKVCDSLAAHPAASHPVTAGIRCSPLHWINRIKWMHSLKFWKLQDSALSETK